MDWHRLVPYPGALFDKGSASFSQIGFVEENCRRRSQVHEVPFSLQIGSDHHLYTQVKGENNLPSVLSGVIPL